MPSDCAPGQVSAHIAEFCHRYQKQNVKLAGDDSGARSRREINNFGDEIEEPQHIEQTEQSISHRLQRLVVTQTREHLPGEHRQQKKEQGRDFEIVRSGRTDFGEVIETADQHDRAAN